MKRSSRLIILVGIFFALIAVVGVVFLLPQQNPPPGGSPTPPPKVNVVYATVDIPQGTLITSSMVTTKTFDQGKQPSGGVTTVDAVIGQTARRSVTADEPILLEDVQGGVSVNIPKELKPGERAFAFQVDQVNGIGTLIQPGDHVDVVMGITDPNFPVVVFPAQQSPFPKTWQKIGDLNSTSVKMLVQNLRVVATLLPPPPAQATPAPGQAQPAQSPAPALTGQQEIVILAVTAQQAEVLKWAQLQTNVSLLLRSSKDETAPPDSTTGIVLKTLIAEYGVIPPRLVETQVP